MNRNNWLLTIIGNNKIKTLKYCPRIGNKDQYVLFKNGKQMGGIHDYDALLSKVISIESCDGCYVDTECRICLESVTEVGVDLIFSFNYNYIVYYDAYLLDSNEVIITDITTGIDEVTNQPFSVKANSLYRNSQLILMLTGYVTTDKDSLCYTRKYPIIAKSLNSGISIFDISLVFAGNSCSSDYTVELITGPVGLLFDYDVDANTITLLNNTTSVDNKFIFSIVCNGCIIGLYTVSTRP
ncbi:MAG TPA: hypothetical protein PKD00_01870 [Burkholderiales bacterium]|nr:hypothetical protein [Burkholderiales bacterium]